MECQDCGEEVATNEVVRVLVGKKTLKLCEECADKRKEEATIADEAESAMKDMMGYKGR